MTHSPNPAPAGDLEPLILNEALELALEWGENFLKPTQPRLTRMHPRLSESQLDAYDAAARVVMSAAFAMLYESPDAERGALERHVHADHPWVDAGNLSRLYSQGVYFAHK